VSKPRIPENFPRMKVRGGRRRRDARFRTYWTSVQDIDWSSLAVRIQAAFDGMARAFEEAGRQLGRMIATTRAALAVHLWRQHNHWVATHQLPATPSSYAAPIER
jgi:hypothetical protein